MTLPNIKHAISSALVTGKSGRLQECTGTGRCPHGPHASSVTSPEISRIAMEFNNISLQKTNGKMIPIPSGPKSPSQGKG